MADPRRVELDDLVNRPGTYFNPQTEVLIVVDDSPELDSEIFNMEEFEGADWVQISDELPVDEHRRDELLEAFQVHLHAGSAEEEDDGGDSSDELEADDQEAGREYADPRSRGRPRDGCRRLRRAATLAAVEDRRALLHLQHVLSGGLDAGAVLLDLGGGGRGARAGRSGRSGRPVEPSEPPPTEPSIPASTERSLVVNWL